jgi:hypothetical protein
VEGELQSLCPVSHKQPLFQPCPAGEREEKDELLADLYMASYVALLQAAAIKELEKALCNLLSYTLLRPKLPA